MKNSNIGHDIKNPFFIDLLNSKEAKEARMKEER